MWGVFKAGVCVEWFFTSDVARRAMLDRYPEDDAFVAEVCAFHEDEEAEDCELCLAEGRGDVD